MKIQRFLPYRSTAEIRNDNAEITLSVNDFIAPHFIVEGNNICREIPALHAIYQLSIDRLLPSVGKLLKKGIDKVLLFGTIENHRKDEQGTYAFAENGLVQEAIRNLKITYPEVTVFTDVCLCGYTHHGHCGILDGSTIDNDKTLEVLARISVSHARAGADFVCPSAMMDGQVGTIKKSLDEEGFQNTRILSYSAKYASSMYGPFREAVESAPSFGNRKTYQMDYRTLQQGIEECAADVDEGTDYLMVKPAHTYLDMIQRIKTRFPEKPLVAYHVSGEYMLIKAAAKLGIADEKEAMLEVLTAIKRAGANYIISYYAEAFADQSLKQKSVL